MINNYISHKIISATKDKINTSSIQFGDQLFRILNIGYLEKDIDECDEHTSDCGRTAQFIIQLATNSEWRHPRIWDFFYDMSQPINKDNDLWIVNLSSFWEDSFKENIFTDTGEHALYHILIAGGAHAFIIEKIPVPLPLFRIYQSWSNLFTLHEWLNPQLYNPKNVNPSILEDIKNDMINFGGGKCLPKNELMDKFKDAKLFKLPVDDPDCFRDAIIIKFTLAGDHKKPSIRYGSFYSNELFVKASEKIKLNLLK